MILNSKFRELAHIYHPDKNDGKTSDTFLRIQEAYLVLSDPKSRLRYDMYMNELNNTVHENQKHKDYYSENNMTKEEK